jgi:hypothetical protein
MPQWVMSISTSCRDSGAGSYANGTSACLAAIAAWAWMVNATLALGADRQ